MEGRNLRSSGGASASTGDRPSAIEDHIYDAYLRLLRGEAETRRADLALVHGFSKPEFNGIKLVLDAEHIDEALGSSDYRLVDKDERRLLPRRSEVPLVLRYYADKHWLECARRGVSLHNHLQRVLTTHYVGVYEHEAVAELLATHGYLHRQLPEAAAGAMPALASPSPMHESDLDVDELDVADHAEVVTVDSMDASHEAQLIDHYTPMRRSAALPVGALASDARRSEKRDTPKFVPISDQLYDGLVMALNGDTVEHLNDHLRKKVFEFLQCFSTETEHGPDYSIRAELLPEEGDGILSGGWRVVESMTGRVLPRLSEHDVVLSRLWDALRQEMPVRGKKSSRQIPINLLTERASQYYVGISSARVQKFIDKQEFLNVKFPTRPQFIAERPMQFVQVDVIEMEKSACGSKFYDNLLVVRCLFSKYYFGRALIGTDKPLITRHLVDIFVNFGPPQGFRSYTNRELCEDAMADVASVFNVEFTSYGRIKQMGSTDHYQLRKCCYDKAVEARGSNEFWVESLPFALMELNQICRSTSACQIVSPFEMMFVRQPWMGEGVPPWLATAHEAQDAADLLAELNDESDEQSFQSRLLEHQQLKAAGSNFPQKRHIRRSLAGQNTVAQRRERDFVQKQRQVRAFLAGSKTALNGDAAQREKDPTLPETGFKYRVGDVVFVRLGDEMESDRRRAPMHFRGEVISVNFDLSEPYRVRLCEPDENGDENSVVDVGIYDVTASTRELHKLRACGRDFAPKEPDRCQCVNMRCRLPRSGGAECPNKMSAACCRRQFLSDGKECMAHKHLRHVAVTMPTRRTPMSATSASSRYASRSPVHLLQRRSVLTPAQLATRVPTVPLSRQKPLSQQKTVRVEPTRIDSGSRASLFAAPSRTPTSGQSASYQMPLRKVLYVNKSDFLLRPPAKRRFVDVSPEQMDDEMDAEQVEEMVEEEVVAEGDVYEEFGEDEADLASLADMAALVRAPPPHTMSTPADMPKLTAESRRNEKNARSPSMAASLGLPEPPKSARGRARVLRPTRGQGTLRRVAAPFAEAAQ